MFGILPSTHFGDIRTRSLEMPGSGLRVRHDCVRRVQIHEHLQIMGLIIPILILTNRSESRAKGPTRDSLDSQLRVVERLERSHHALKREALADELSRGVRHQVSLRRSQALHFG
jgi:hypothetical protein